MNPQNKIVDELELGNKYVLFTLKHVNMCLLLLKDFIHMRLTIQIHKLLSESFNLQIQLEVIKITTIKLISEGVAQEIYFDIISK